MSYLSEMAGLRLYSRFYSFLFIAFASLSVACVQEHFHYGESDPVKVKAFLVEQNILKESDEETIYALIDWSRRNIVHAEGPLSEMEEVTILDVIEKGKKDGYIEIAGCWGTTDFFQQTLGAAGIDVINDTVRIGNRLHSSAAFPSIGKTALHGDDLHSWKVSSRTGEVPPNAVLAESSHIHDGESIDVMYEKKQDDIIQTFRPDVINIFRIRYYGKFYSQEEIANDRSGKERISDVSTDTNTLKLVDEEIDRLGGPDVAREVLKGLIDFPEYHRELVPNPPDKSYKPRSGGF